MRHLLNALLRASPGPLLGVLLLVLLAGAHLPAAALAEDEPTGVWPLDPEPEVVRGFEPPPSPYASGHRGADLAGTPGQVVRSALPGTVAFAGSIGGKPVVTVRHGARRTTYEPVVATVSVGDRVTAGDPVGHLVVTDSHCFPAACLHWGLIVGTGDAEVYADPLTLVGAGPVRLLPLWRDEPVTPRLPALPPVPLLSLWTPPLRASPRALDFLV